MTDINHARVSASTAVTEATLPNRSIHTNNNFNFLRLLFASLVLVSHGPEIADGNRSRELLTRFFGTLSFGELAVDCFFLLSGYLIVKSWERTPELGNFFSKRVRRIYPGFVVAFMLCTIVVGPLATPSASSYFHNLGGMFLPRALLRAMLLYGPYAPAPGAFIGSFNPALNGAMWSIPYEFRCYAAVALVGVCGAKRQKHIWLVLFLVFLVLLGVSQQVGLNLPGPLFSTVGGPSELVRVFTFFSAGACFYLFRHRIQFNGKVAAGAVPVLAAGLFQPTLASIVLVSLGAYLLFWVAFAKIPALQWFKTKDDISYGLYLYGWPIQKLLQWYFPTRSPWVLLPAALLLAGVAGYASWHLVEARWLRRTRKTAVELRSQNEAV